MPTSWSCRWASVCGARWRTRCESLSSGSPALIDQILRHEAVVNALERAIDELAGQIIARRQPAAGDLRFVLAVANITTDLERVGDEAKKIALQARKIFSDGSRRSRAPVEVRRMAAIVQDMLRAAVAALETLDPRAAVALARRDEESDLVFQAVLRQLISFMIEDPRTITACLDMLFVAKSLERIGDHARERLRAHRLRRHRPGRAPRYSAGARAELRAARLIRRP